MVEGLSLSQFTTLIRGDSCVVQKWDPRECTISPCTTTWPVAYILSQFHVKHIFPDGRLPDIRKLGRQVSEWITKRKWSIYMHKSQKYDEKYYDTDFRKSEWVRRIRSKLKPVICRHDIFNNDILIYFSELKAGLLDCASKHIERVRRYARYKSIPLVKFALRRISDSGMAILRADKDSSFVLVERGDYNFAARTLLQGIHYSPAVLSDEQYEAIAEEYTRLSAEICTAVVEKYDKDTAIGLNFALIRDLQRAGFKRFLYRLKLQVKTHKAPGKIVARQLHCGSNHPFAPMMRFLGRYLRAEVNKHGHIIRNTRHLIESLSKIRIGSMCTLVKLDIKDFFMSGRHDDLVRAVEKCFTDDFGRTLAAVTRFLLANQYIDNEAEGSELFKVDIGSGMGCIHSGDLSDLCFYVLVECGYILDPGIREALGIVAYFRFKDDILLVMNCDEDGVQECVESIRQRAEYFIVTIDEISTTSVDMLDITLSKDRSWISSGLLHISHYVKPTATGKFLSSDSVHPRSTHLGWPLARIPHFKLCNTTKHDYYESCVKFYNKLARDSPGHSALQGFKYRFLGIQPQSQDFALKPHCTYIAIPFSRVWRGAGFANFLRSVFADHEPLIEKFTSLPMLANIAWCKAGQNLFDTLFMTWKRANTNGRRQG